MIVLYHYIIFYVLVCFFHSLHVFYSTTSCTKSHAFAKKRKTAASGRKDLSIPAPRPNNSPKSVHENETGEEHLIGAVDGERDGEIRMRRREQRALEKQRQLQTAILRLLNPLTRRVRIRRQPEVPQITPRDVA